MANDSDFTRVSCRRLKKHDVAVDVFLVDDAHDLKGPPRSENLRYPTAIEIVSIISVVRYNNGTICLQTLFTTWIRQPTKRGCKLTSSDESCVTHREHGYPESI